MNETEETTQKLQQIELKILEIFVKICEKENLHYYLLGGTLIGAVRHKGFIPWDDDIDVGMPRADYERFLSCASKYLPKEYFLQTYKTDKEYPFPYAKIRDTRTILKENALQKLSINHGVWIDIFPLDFCPVNYFWFIWRHNFLRLRVMYALYGWKYANIKLIFLRALACLLHPSLKNVVKRDDELMRSYQNDTTLISNLSGRYGRKEIVPSSWFKEPAWLEFEGLKVAAPTEYHKYLTHIYGDYMKLPPEEKRVAQHRTVEIKL